MKRAVALAVCCLAADWKHAEPGWQPQFPRDHHLQADFKTEWWYATGHLADDSGARFGYEVTFFRQGVRPPHSRDAAMSRFVVGDIKFAHFAITDISGRDFRFETKASRGAYQEAGFSDGNRIAWIDDWNLTLTGDNTFELEASMAARTLRLQLRATKPPVVHGESGVSTGSHYYSLTRVATTGALIEDGKSRKLGGESWFDHQWSTTMLPPEEVGWDWLWLHLDDGSDLMLFLMRRKDGSASASSSGTLIAPDGSSTHLPAAAFRMEPVRFWKSKKTGGNYPIDWRVELPGQRLEFTVSALLDDQEVAATPLNYWEGAIEAKGTRGGVPIKGRGYLELTGYAGPVQGLQR